MNILFALSQLEVTGAETYALALAQALEGLGHKVIFVSDTLRNTQDFKFIPLPIHAGNESTLGRIRNLFQLKKIIREQKIQLLHGHSRAANLLCHFARGKLPMVVSVHGRWRNHFAFRALPCLGQATIAICPALQRYLVQDIGAPKNSVRMIPNGINLNYFQPSEPNPGQELLFVGRFSGQKGNVIRFLIQQILPQLSAALPEIKFKIVSSQPLPTDLAMVRTANENLKYQAVEVFDAAQDLRPFYAAASVVIGSGRVAMEALASARPVVAIGESSAPGLLTEQSFTQAFDSNFGDCGEWNLFQKDNHLLRDLQLVLKDALLQKELSGWGRQKAAEFFDAQRVAAQVQELYQSLVRLR